MQIRREILFCYKFSNNKFQKVLLSFVSDLLRQEFAHLTYSIGTGIFPECIPWKEFKFISKCSETNNVFFLVKSHIWHLMVRLFKQS